MRTKGGRGFEGFEGEDEGASSSLEAFEAFEGPFVLMSRRGASDLQREGASKPPLRPFTFEGFEGFEGEDAFHQTLTFGTFLRGIRDLAHVPARVRTEPCI